MGSRQRGPPGTRGRRSEAAASPGGFDSPSPATGQCSSQLIRAVHAMRPSGIDRWRPGRGGSAHPNDTAMTIRTIGFCRPAPEPPNAVPAPARVTREGGFTLLELLVVMVIIGLLVGYVAPRYFQQVGKSEVKMAQAQIESLQKALDLYRLDTGQYPSTEQGLKALVERPANEAKWAGPYLKKGVPMDPWGRPYLYRYPGEKSELDLYSLGKDGQPGGSGEAADITNR